MAPGNGQGCSDYFGVNMTPLTSSVTLERMERKGSLFGAWTILVGQPPPPKKKQGKRAEQLRPGIGLSLLPVARIPMLGHATDPIGVWQFASLWLINCPGPSFDQGQPPPMRQKQKLLRGLPNGLMLGSVRSSLPPFRPNLSRLLSESPSPTPKALAEVR